MPDTYQNQEANECVLCRAEIFGKPGESYSTDEDFSNDGHICLAWDTAGYEGGLPHVPATKPGNAAYDASNALAEIVHDEADRLASAVIDSRDELNFLRGRGWTAEEIINVVRDNITNDNED